MPTAVLVLDFDPVVRVAGAAVRLETVVLGASILLALLVAAWLCGRTPSDEGTGMLRRDDLLFGALGAAAGAVAGGRVGHVLVHLDYYAANPPAALDPSTGSLELALGVVGGALGGAAIAQLVDGSVGRWLHVAAIPTLALLVLGKVATALGGGGQGAPSDVAWATAYGGPGPWRSLAPQIASHPSQLYEAAAAFVVLVVVVGLLAGGAFAARDGRAFLVAIALWAVARAIVGATWRDDPVLGPLRTAQLVALLVAVGAAGLAWLGPAIRRRAGSEAAIGAEPSWPDPATRPPF